MRRPMPPWRQHRLQTTNTATGLTIDSQKAHDCRSPLMTSTIVFPRIHEEPWSLSPFAQATLIILKKIMFTKSQGSG
jgi:hypothetical protein